MGKKSSVEHLNSFLRGEMSAVETYKMALDKIDELGATRDELVACLKSHQDRVQLLTEMILASGGKPAESSGPWGLFAKTVEAGAKVFGERATIAALEEGEDHGRDDYEDEIARDELDPTSRNLVVDRLLPMQRLTHDRMSALKHRR